jgi:hypothetical protein
MVAVLNVDIVSMSGNHPLNQVVRAMEIRLEEIRKQEENVVATNLGSAKNATPGVAPWASNLPQSFTFSISSRCSKRFGGCCGKMGRCG